MHIVEVDEHLDYGKFYEFPETEKDITKAAGRRTWEILHGLAENYPCPPCKPVFQTLMSGAHDVVNVHLGKGVYDKEKFLEFSELVAEAVDKAGLAGEVAHHHEHRHEVEGEHGR